MPSRIPNIIAAAHSAIWAMEESKLNAVLELLAIRAAESTPANRRELQRRRQLYAGASRSGVRMAGQVAVLPLQGVIAHHAGMEMQISGGTSTVGFGRVFNEAMNNPDVSAIVIDCDSPGGTVEGVPELAAQVYAARGKGKRIIASCNAHMESAAYWICSQADEIHVTPSGELGSVGVRCMHTDVSGADAKAGVKRTVITYGANKAGESPYAPMSEDALAARQERVDQVGKMFDSAVARGRGVSPAKVRASFGQGLSFGAQQAVALGMADKVMTLEQTLASLGAVGGARRPMAAVRADASDDLGDDDTPEECPECGEPMDEDADGLVCSACGYRTAGYSAARTALRNVAAAAAVTGLTAPEDIVALAALWDAAGEAGHVLSLNDAQVSALAHHRSSLTLVAGAGAPVADLPPSPTPPAPKARSNSVTQEELAAQRAAIEAEMTARTNGIVQMCEAHGIPMTATTAYITGRMTAEQVGLDIAKIKRAERGADPVINVGAQREAERPFTNAADQIFAIVQAGRGRRPDPRLLRVNHNAMRLDRDGAMDMMAASGMSEGVASDGGFFLAPEVLPGVVEPVYQDDPFLSRVTRIPIGATTNRTTYNVVDESARTDGSRWGGISMSWSDEAGAGTPSKPKLRQIEQLLKKLIGIGYLTDEQLEDTAAAEPLITKAFTTELQFMLTNGAFRGKGSGQMVGFLNGKGGVSQAIEATQTVANTNQFIGMNVTKMLSNIPATLWSDVVIMYNQELLPYLVNATIGTSGVVPLFIGAGGMTNRPFDSILGKPAYASEFCEAPGTVGDIVAIAPSQYHIAEKGGAQIATSLHVRFLNDEMALRITYRVDGKPVWNTTVTPFKGTNTRGFFSTLAVRT